MSIVTAVIPCYNAEGFLDAAIRSVHEQTLAVAELIVVDDRSTDNSRAVAERAGARVLSTPAQGGPGSARNVGAGAARTPYLAFLDADDLWLPHHCATLVPLLQRFPEAAVAFGRIQKFGDATTESSRWGEDARPGEALPGLLRENPVPQSATIVERAKFFEVGGYAEGARHSEDFDLWLRLAERFPFVASHRITCRYRVHASQATRSLPALIRGGWTARIAARDRLRHRGAWSAAFDRLLLEALHDDIGTAWSIAHAGALRELLTLAPEADSTGRAADMIRSHLRWVGLRATLLRLGRPLRNLRKEIS